MSCEWSKCIGIVLFWANCKAWIIIFGAFNSRGREVMTPIRVGISHYLPVKLRPRIDGIAVNRSTPRHKMLAKKFIFIPSEQRSEGSDLWPVSRLRKSPLWWLLLPNRERNGLLSTLWQHLTMKTISPFFCWCLYEEFTALHSIWGKVSCIMSAAEILSGALVFGLRH